MFYRKFGTGDQKYVWTLHARLKMKYYGLSENRVKRIIRFPARTEEGIVLKTVAVMQPAGTKRYSEIWTMYKIVGRNRQANPKSEFLNPKQRPKLKVITAWRYPGKSPARNPIPSEILREIRQIL